MTLTPIAQLEAHRARVLAITESLTRTPAPQHTVTRDDSAFLIGTLLSMLDENRSLRELLSVAHFEIAGAVKHDELVHGIIRSSARERADKIAAILGPAEIYREVEPPRSEPR